MSSPTLTDKVAKLICQDILIGNLTPGQKLVVAELKDKYQLGASPIREALVQLSWDKYVILEPQKGCRVAPICGQELGDLYESLRVISAILLKDAISSADENWELSVLTAFHKLSRIQVNEQTDWHEWEERLHQFYLALFDGAKPQNMYQFSTQLINQIRRYRYYASAFRTDYSLCNIEQYEKIMKLALAKDAKAAVAAFDHYLIQTAKVLKPLVPVTS
ncbi:GntR family transcriptional regulator [Vibrio sp. TRT 17S01]|uniref:GntR family transcriptional regulator n=1 Tax=Vibrio sp. TRT 17S01 TaxID=3418505 RepID=UPI003CED0E65